MILWLNQNLNYKDVHGNDLFFINVNLIFTSVIGEGLVIKICKNSPSDRVAGHYYYLGLTCGSHPFRIIVPPDESKKLLFHLLKRNKLTRLLLIYIEPHSNTRMNLNGSGF